MHWVNWNSINIETNITQSILVLIRMLASLCLWSYLFDSFSLGGQTSDLQNLFSELHLYSIACAPKFIIQFLYVMPWFVLSLLWKCSSFLLNLTVRSLSIGIISYVSVTSLHRSWQNVWILLRCLLLYLFYISILFLFMQLLILFRSSTTFSRKSLPSLTFFFWINMKSGLNSAHVTYSTLATIMDIYGHALFLFLFLLNSKVLERNHYLLSSFMLFCFQ